MLFVIIITIFVGYGTSECNIRCLLNPCTVSTCSNFPSATCSGDCCTAPIWTDADGTNVTGECAKEAHYVCALPSETGPCRAAFRRWFNNVETNQCEEFIYGGCRGNENNFEAKADCDKACRQDGSDDTSCVKILCDRDPYCCDKRWDKMCRKQAQKVCDGKELPKCCGCTYKTDEKGIGCVKDEDCEEEICSNDAFCCGEDKKGVGHWDHKCRKKAKRICELAVEMYE
eukprot:331859_1